MVYLIDPIFMMYSARALKSIFSVNATLCCWFSLEAQCGCFGDFQHPVFFSESKQLIQDLDIGFSISQIFVAYSEKLSVKKSRTTVMTFGSGLILDEVLGPGYTVGSCSMTLKCNAMDFQHPGQ